MAKLLICVITVLVGAGSVTAQGDSASFSVGGLITHYAADKEIYLGLFASEKQFWSQQPEKRLRFGVHALPPDSLRYRFEGVAPGYYIIAGYQDLNGDRVMNKGLFGRPVEPYRIYRPHFGIFAPKFDKCKFEVSGNIDTAHICF